MSRPDLFDTLFRPISATQFIDEYWPDRACWSDGASDRLPAPLQHPLLKNIEALTLGYRGRLSFGNAKTGSRTVAIEQVSPNTLLNMGLSLYLPEIEKLIPDLTQMLRDAEVRLGIPPNSARIGAFVAPAENGVTCHLDAEDVISIQLVGSKRFHISREAGLQQPYGMQYNPGDVTFDDMYPQATHGFPDPDSVDYDCVHMQPGSALFMPRGTFHRTETEGLSLSVSIILRAPSAFETVLDALRARLLQDPAWRKPLHGAWANGGDCERAEQRLEQLLGQLPEIAGSLTLEDIRQSAYSEADRLAAMHPESYFQAKPESTLKIRLRGQAMEAKVVSKDIDGCERETLQLNVPLPMVAVIEWLSRTRRPFMAQALADAFPDLPMEQHLRILRVLAQGEYLKPLWYRPTVSD